MDKIFFSALPALVCAFWTLNAVFHFTINRSRSRILLMVFMAVATGLYVGHFVFLNHMTAVMPFFDTIYAFANLAVYPLFYLFILSLTSPLSRLRRHSLLLIPAIVVGVIVGVLYLLMSPTECQEYVQRGSYHEDFLNASGLPLLMGYVRLVAKFIFAIEVVYVLVAGTRSIKSYQQMLTSYYADTEDKDLTPIQWFMYLFAVCSLLSSVFNIIGREMFAESSLVIIPSLLFSSLLFALGFFGIHQENVIEVIEREDASSPVSHDEQSKANVRTDLADRVEEVVTHKQLYLQPNLKVSDLARELCTNRFYVSQAINDRMGVSFSDYINQKRIQYAVQLMKEHPEMPIIEISAQAGYTSDKSFFRNFKKITGHTPKSKSLSNA